LSEIHEASSIVVPAELDIPYHKVEYIESDQPTRLDLATVLNATVNNQKLYANFWRNPDFLVTDELYSYILLAVNVFVVIMVGIFFRYFFQIPTNQD